MAGIERRWKGAFLKGDVCGMVDFVELGGGRRYEQALRFIATAPKRLQKLDMFRVHMYAEDAISAERAAEVRQVVQAAYPGVSGLSYESKPYNKTEDPKSVSLDEIIKWLRDNPKSTFIGSWMIRVASDETLAGLAQFIVDHPEDELLYKFLTAFSRKRVWPLDVAPIIQISAETNDFRTSALAVRVLSGVSNTRIRDLALDKASRGRRIFEVPELLLSSFQEGDEAVVLDVLRRITNHDHYHSAAMDARNLAEAHPKSNFGPTLRHIYDNVTCGLCRYAAVKNLNLRKEITPDMVAEMVFDSELEVQKLGRRLRTRQYED